MENYIQPNLSDIQAVSIIKSKIKNDEPFAFTRFGDGEIFVLKKQSYPEFEKKNCREWGYQYPEEVQNFYDDGFEIIKNAFIGSDLIGIMDKNCKIVNINYSPSTWSIQKSLISSWGLNPDDLNICDHQLSRQKIFGSISGMKEIVGGRDIHIISSNVERMKNKNLDELLECNVSYTFHPMDVNFNNRDNFISQFSNIKPKIVLLGVGLQKDYTTILKNKFGKISLDMGATMDAWAGIYSRPWFSKGNRQDFLIV